MQIENKKGNHSPLGYCATHHDEAIGCGNVKDYNEGAIEVCVEGWRSLRQLNETG